MSRAKTHARSVEANHMMCALALKNKDAFPHLQRWARKTAILLADQYEASLAASRECLLLDNAYQAKLRQTRKGQR
jgi:hypothetical protein